MIEERLPDGHHWWRVCGHDWDDPLDDSFAQRAGGRWNPPNSWRTLYLNRDLATARVNLRRFIADWPYAPEDLRDDTGPDLAGARLPRRQVVLDAHTVDGLAAVDLPPSYPLDAEGEILDHATCQAVGEEVKEAGLRGVLCTSVQAPTEGVELAWFPATARSRAHLVARLSFSTWFRAGVIQDGRLG